MAIASESWELVATVRFCPPRPSQNFGFRISDCGFGFLCGDLVAVASGPLTRVFQSEIRNPQFEIPVRIVGPVGSRHGVASAETPVRIRYDAPVFYAPVAQLEERDASNVDVAGPSPARSSKLIAEVM